MDMIHLARKTSFQVAFAMCASVYGIGTLQTVIKAVEYTNKGCRCRKWVLKICKRSCSVTPFLVK